MGMDGLSMSNTGALKESTSADLANRTEQVIQSDATNDPKMVQTLSTNRRVKEKEDEEEAPKQKQQGNINSESEHKIKNNNPSFKGAFITSLAAKSTSLALTPAETFLIAARFALRTAS